MIFGLQRRDLAEINNILQKFPSIEEAIIFGSRAKGNFKTGSDVDLAIKGLDISHEVLASLSYMLNEESAMPYYFDVVHFEAISEKELTEHMKRVGQCIYIKMDNSTLDAISSCQESSKTQEITTLSRPCPPGNDL
jgi:uncharacterized protein